MGNCRGSLSSAVVDRGFAGEARPSVVEGGTRRGAEQSPDLLARKDRFLIGTAPLTDHFRVKAESADIPCEDASLHAVALTIGVRLAGLQNRL